MPWEEPDRETGTDRMPVKEDGTFAAAIGLEVTGSAEFITDANILIEEFQDIFSSDLGQEPADLPLLDVTIDTASGIVHAIKYAHETNPLKDNRRFGAM